MTGTGGEAAGGGALWSAAEAVKATGGRTTRDWQARGVSIDTRSLEAGDLFVALEGPNHDGHSHVAAALEKGAAAAMVARRPEGLAPEGTEEDAPLLLVEDTLEALWDLGRAGRGRSPARVVGVTGSVGKTGTKEALRICLSEQGKTAASAASYNNHWGVPLSLARMAPDSAFGVFELGMNHPGEIGPLSRMAKPDVAVITTVQPVHLAYFENVLQIADAKAEIFQGLRPGGAAVLNRDNPFFPNLLEQAEARDIGRIVAFGRHPEANVRLLDCSLHASCSSVQVLVRDQALDYCIPLPGEHWVLNSLAVLGAVWALGADVARAAAAFSRLEAIKGRGERHLLEAPGGAFLLIDESYNANPASVRAALAVLGRSDTQGKGRRIAVLGDMLELGAGSAERHARLAEAVTANRIDLVFTCGPEMAVLHEALPEARRGGHAADSSGLSALVAAAIGPGDAVMVKGSLGSRMAQVVEAIRQQAAEYAQTHPRAPEGASPPPRAVNGN